MSNPYIHRGPVRSARMFFGRHHELREIVAFLNGNQSVSLVGPRKIGKTSLLYHLLRPDVWPEIGMEAGNLLVYLDCEVLGNCSHEEIFATFAAEISATLDERGLLPEPELDLARSNPSRLSFERAVRKLNQHGLQIILMLDEFERLSTNPHLDVNFFNALRSATARYQLAFLTASAQPLIQLTYSNQTREILSSPFFNIFASLYLGLLPENEARQIIHQPAANAGQPFSPDIEDFIYHFAGGYPLGLQVTCFHAYELQQNGASPAADEIERLAAQELAPHFEYYWHNLSVSEQETLRRLNDAAARATSDTTLRSILRDLIQKCLLVQEGGLYHYSMHAWAGFINAQTMVVSAGRRESGSLVGLIIGPYQIIEPIGRGGMAEVYLGRHTRLGRPVAIKVLPARLVSQDNPGQSQFAQRFEREARAVAALRHPHIVQVFDFGDLEGTYYMVMEYIRGLDLSHLLHQQSALEFSLAQALLTELASALDHAHNQGLVHRDIKPSNVMLEELTPLESQNMPHAPALRPYRVVLTDFGIAKILGGDTATQTGMLMGTLDYMAPEQIRSAGNVDHRADIYALGIMAYQMLTGRLPLQGDNAGAVMMAHLQATPADPRSLVPEIPECTAQALLKAMAKEPADRFDSAGTMIKAMFGA